MRENLELVKEKISSKYKIIEPGITRSNSDFYSPDGNQLFLKLKCSDIAGALITLKNDGFRHLSLISCIDWIEQGEFEIQYHLFRWDDGGRVSLKTRIPREEPKIHSIMSIWPTSSYYEQDIHEFFGVDFEGNPKKEPLFLEFWNDIPPMRKDFDPLEYSRKYFDEREYDQPFVPFVIEEDEEE